MITGTVTCQTKVGNGKKRTLEISKFSTIWSEDKCARIMLFNRKYKLTIPVSQTVTVSNGKLRTASMDIKRQRCPVAGPVGPRGFQEV